MNARQANLFIDTLEKELDGFSSRTIAIFGLAFKPNTDDLRDAKSIEIISRLLASGSAVRAYDPIAMDKARDIFPNIYYGDSAYDAATGADAIIIITSGMNSNNRISSD